MGLAEPPSLDDAGKMLNETVVVNNPIRLECRAAGNPPPGWFTFNISENRKIAVGVMYQLVTKGSGRVHFR